MGYSIPEKRREYHKKRHQRRKAVDPFYWRKRDLEHAKSVRQLRKENDPVKHKRLQMLSSARGRAKKLNIPFSISVDDVVFTPICPVLGIELDWLSSKCHEASPSLDRFIPSAGYVPGNVNVISHKANSIKRDASLEDLLAIVDWVRQHVENKE